MILTQTPKIPGEVLQKIWIRARRDSVHRIVAAHDGFHMRITNATLERRGIKLSQILRRHDGIERHPTVALPVLHIIRSPMLADCCNLQVRLVVGGALKPSDELIHVLRDVKRVFGGRFLPPSPAGIFEWVDIGRENVQACATKVIERAELCTDYSGYIVDQGIVECGRREDWGREGRCIAEVEARCSKGDAGTACNAVLCDFTSEVILR